GLLDRKDLLPDRSPVGRGLLLLGFEVPDGPGEHCVRIRLSRGDPEGIAVAGAEARRSRRPGGELVAETGELVEGRRGLGRLAPGRRLLLPREEPREPLAVEAG